jgi:hypothetical protein
MVKPLQSLIIGNFAFSLASQGIGLRVSIPIARRFHPALKADSSPCNPPGDGVRG